MALPQPIYPRYRPQSFLEPGGGGVLTKALELYAKYHPGAMQQRLYATLLEDETFQAKQRSEQRKVLIAEREQVMRNLSRFRESGLGPSGRAGGASGSRKGTGRGAFSNLDDFVDLAGQDTNRLIKSKDMSTEQFLMVAKQFQPSAGHEKLIENIVGKTRGSRVLDSTQLMAIIANESDNLAEVLAAADARMTETQKQAAAAQLWSRLTSAGRFPGLVEYVEINGKQVPKATDAGLRIAQLIDESFRTNFVTAALGRNEFPTAVLERRQIQQEQTVGSGVPKSALQVKLAGMMDDALADGVITGDEEKRIEEYRKIHGLTAPLDEAEQVFLRSYIEALRDDGVATREELGADFDQAQAAYEKGRNLERLPRGMAAFYDESYLRGLGRLSQIDEQMTGLRETGSPVQTAARRTLGLPVVSVEAMQAASQVHPMAGEVLPYAMRRVMESGGAVEPRDSAESWAANYVQTEGDNRDFGALVNAVTKAFPEDSLARRNALAFYGATHYQKDMKNQTINTAALDGNAAGVVDQEVATVETAFLDEAGKEPTGVVESPGSMASRQDATVPFP